MPGHLLECIPWTVVQPLYKVPGAQGPGFCQIQAYYPPNAPNLGDTIYLGRLSDLAGRLWTGNPKKSAEEGKAKLGRRFLPLERMTVQEMTRKYEKVRVPS